MRALNITGLVLAGGRARRFGGEDKGLIELAGRPMIEHVLAALAPQVRDVLISANRNVERYREFGHRVLRDRATGYDGPLAGIASGLAQARTAFLLVAPCDAPFLSSNLAWRLHAILVECAADQAIAHDGTRCQPAFALLSTRLRPALETWLDSGNRTLSAWYRSRGTAVADMSDEAGTFVNVNTAADLTAADARLRAVAGDLPPPHTRE